MLMQLTLDIINLAGQNMYSMLHETKAMQRAHQKSIRCKLHV